MKNIELKVKVSSFASVTRLLQKSTARKVGRLRQIDTYFKCRTGRLKLREINHKQFNLIWYSRPNTKTSRVSDYELLLIPKRQVADLKRVLKASFGELVVVKKVRLLWMYKHTRIHLDTVEKRGTFLELETIITAKTRSQARAEHQEVISLLQLRQYKTLRTSYSDMLLRKRT